MGMTHEHRTARALPPLPLDEWEDTKETLHRYCQIAGKVRMECSPFRNHWWHVTLYVTTCGLTTGPIPYGRTTFDISFDLLENRLDVSTSDKGEFSFALDDLPVAEFYRRLFDGLNSLDIDVSVNPKPFGLDDDHTLDENTFHYTCNGEYVRRFHRVLAWVDQVFKEFAGRFNGKTSPVQLFWHSFDLAVTRFSGRRAPQEAGRRQGHARGLLPRGHLLRLLARRRERPRARLLFLHRPRAGGFDRTSAESRRGKLAPGGWHGTPDLREGSQQLLPYEDPAGVYGERLPGRGEERGMGYRGASDTPAGQGSGEAQEED